MDLVDLKDIVVGDRLREEYDSSEHSIVQLCDSIREHGLIHPIVLRRQDNALVAGGRRYRAFTLLRDEDPEKFSKVPVNYLDDLPDHELRALELEENLQRKSMTWQEYAKAIRDVHKLKVSRAGAKGEKWGQRQTGQLLGHSVAQVNYAIKVATALDRGELKSATSFSDAIAKLIKAKEDEAIAESARRATPTKKDGPSFTAPREDNPLAKLLAGEKVEKPAAPTSLTEVPLSSMLFQGDCIEWMRGQQGNKFDHIVTDIPYGIDMKNLEDMAGHDRVVAEHDVVENVALMAPFLEAAFHILKPTGYLLFFYDLAHHEKLVTAATKAGFKVQRWPLIWIKEHPCKNGAPQLNWTKTYEPIFVARMPEACLNDPQPRAHFAAEGLTEKRAQSNPFAKPFTVVRWLLQAVGYQGQTIYDPFAGGGSILRAAVQLGFKPYGTEISPTHFPELVSNLKQIYTDMYRGNVEFS